MSRISASIVTYKSRPAELTGLLEALHSSGCVGEWMVIDNGACEEPQQALELRALVERYGGNYLAAPRNLGFGAGHNLALKTLKSAEFHLLLNPDILFGPDVLPSLLHVMEARAATALVMPRILYPDGSPQLLCKLLPTPLDFALRRFSPGWLKRVFHKRLDQYELCELQHTACNKAPFLSGCFMFTRRAALDAVGAFDESYFLYMEDVDLCRRLARTAELLYWPDVHVVHGCSRGAYHSTALMLIFLRSAVRYFNRWGWFFDSERRRANCAALEFLAASRDDLLRPAQRSLL